MFLPKNFIPKLGLMISLIMGILIINGCSQPQVTPPPINQFSQSYFQSIHGSKTTLKQISNYYFMPTSWRYQNKIKKQIEQQQNHLKTKQLTLEPIATKQSGRWGIIVVKKENAKGIFYNPIWVFYYDKKWQIISPTIFHEGVVRNMLDLYREQEGLVKWYTQHPEWHAKINH